MQLCGIPLAALDNRPAANLPRHLLLMSEDLRLL
jgi:hypothetical protein